MNKSNKKLKFTFTRIIPAPAAEVFDGWLDPKVAGNPWNAGDKLILDPQKDGLFYWRMMGTSHYGRFTQVERPSRIQHTWMSPNTLGEESTVTVSFKKKGEDTVMTLVHSGLPDDDKARSHEKGWNYFLGLFPEQFPARPRRKG